MDEHLDWKLSAPSDWITSGPVADEAEYDLLADDHAGLTIDQSDLGSADFVLPDGTDDTQIWVTTGYNEGHYEPRWRVREMHATAMRPVLQLASETVIRPQPKVEAAYRLYDRERKVRKDRIVAFARANPGLSGNKIITAIGGNRNRMTADIKELIADGVLYRGRAWGLFVR